MSRGKTKAGRTGEASSSMSGRDRRAGYIMKGSTWGHAQTQGPKLACHHPKISQAPHVHLSKPESAQPTRYPRLQKQKKMREREREKKIAACCPRRRQFGPARVFRTCSDAHSKDRSLSDSLALGAELVPTLSLFAHRATHSPQSRQCLRFRVYPPLSPDATKVVSHPPGRWKVRALD